ncbi:MAG: hypothetical protein ACYCW6_15830, partial [Candidatus Xenobia bacterium]
MITARQRLFMWVPQKWSRDFSCALAVYPWQRYTLTRFWCRRSVLSSDWINALFRWVMGSPDNALTRQMPDVWSQWMR